MSHRCCAFVLMSLTLMSGLASRASGADAELALSGYVHQPDESFGWTVRQQGALGTGRYAELILTSQTWRGVTWRHQLIVYRPAEVAADAKGILLINGGAWSPALLAPADERAGRLPREAALFALAADQLGAPLAVLMHVPHQPIFGNRYEDDAIAYSFQQYMETGDASWPLLLPMVKSAVAAMDATQGYAREQWGLAIEQFTVTGGSKRGWTTWLTAAVDPRVVALAPVVFDIVNMRPQLDHQRESFGAPSTSISDYTRRGLADQDALETPAMAALIRMVDPYSYLPRLQQPKLLILATNDSYWPVDALNLYWQSLQGPRYVVYLPNSGHDARDLPRLIGALVGLHQQVQGSRPLPRHEFEFQQQGQTVQLRLNGQPHPEQAVVWSATSATRDFRQATWRAVPMQRASGQYTHRQQPDAALYTAFFGEAVYQGGLMPLHLSTTVQVLPPAER